jgi:hypothetical protein
MNRNLIKCNSIEYRKGYIEVRGDIHADCVNIEAWNVHPDIDITDLDLGDNSMPDDAVIDNTEIELSIKDAEDLVEQLNRAINVARTRKNT